MIGAVERDELDVVAAHRLNKELGLAEWDDRVFSAMQEEHRSRRDLRDDVDGPNVSV